MSVTFLSELMSEISQRGRSFLQRNREQPRNPIELCEALVSRRGEVSSFVLSEAVWQSWDRLDRKGQVDFLIEVAQRFGPDENAVLEALAVAQERRDADAYHRLHRATEPRSQELIRRLNMAKQGTLRLVRMREVLTDAIGEHPALAHLDGDFFHLFNSWFNRGFLELRPINWNTPASILEKFIEYEAVHEINGWDDLRSRIEPKDRRLFAFFHPQMGEEPLIFVEVALTSQVPNSIQSLLATDREEIAPEQATTAVFYSISNCQNGLKGISFGNFLIKQVVEQLRNELPNLKNFVTLSPVPGFRRWLDGIRKDEQQTVLAPRDLEALAALDEPDWSAETESVPALNPLLQGVAAHYFLTARDKRNRVIDPVARFHLGNGAKLDNIHTFADLSANGRRNAYGLMVNYRYEMSEIEANHEAYAERGDVVASPSVRSLLKKFQSKTKIAHAS